MKCEADSVLKDLALLEILNEHGEARVVGSVALNLVVKPDIDLHLPTKTEDLFAVVDQVYHALLEQEDVKHIRISDYRENGGIKIGIDSYPGPTEDWSIDLWVTNVLETTGFALVERLSQRLTDEQRRIILEIKKVLHSRGELRDGMSTEVYTAVVDNGVHTFTEFEKLKEE